MTDTLYDWPPGAKFGSRVPKERFYERTAGSTALRDKFVSQVHRITWMYKLAEETINLPATAEVPEIEVLWLEAKGDDVDASVLAAIDKAIPNPVIFEIHRVDAAGPLARTTAACTTVSTRLPARNVYFSTEWLRADTARMSMPTAISLGGLFAELLVRLTPASAKPGESITALGERLASLSRIEREIASLERKLRSEPQLNRKIELRRALRDRQAALAALV